MISDIGNGWFVGRVKHSTRVTSADAWITGADAYTMETETDAAANTNPIDEQCRRAAGGGKGAFDEFVLVDEIGALDLGIADLDYGNRVVRLPRLIDGQQKEM